MQVSHACGQRGGRQAFWQRLTELEPASARWSASGRHSRSAASAVPALHISDASRQQRRGVLHDPTVIDEVQALKKPVVGHLPLKLREGPAARDGQAPELACEGVPE